jgi:hypothetical protein
MHLKEINHYELHNYLILLYQPHFINYVSEYQ